MISVGIMCHATVGGSARIATHLAAVLCARGYDVTVFSPKRPAFPLPAKVRVRTVCDSPPDPRDHLAVTLDRATFENLRDLVFDAARTGHLDILHFHYALPFAALAHDVRNHLGNGGPRVVGTLHGTDVSLHGAYEPVQNGLLGDLRSADALTTVSESHAVLIRDGFGLDPIVIPNFVDLDVFGPTAMGRRSRPRVLHVSNFRPVKNTLSVARAFAQLYASMDAELWLVGDGETLPATLRELQRGGVPKSAVRCFGVVDNPSQIVAETDVLVLPSHFESFGLAALEAMACGVPVVGTRVGGLSELIDGRGCGLLVTPGDDVALASAVKHALDRRVAWRQGAIRRAADYSVERIVPRYERLYGDLLAPERATVAFASGQVGQ